MRTTHLPVAVVAVLLGLLCACSDSTEKPNPEQSTIIDQTAPQTEAGAKVDDARPVEKGTGDRGTPALDAARPVEKGTDDRGTPDKGARESGACPVQPPTGPLGCLCGTGFVCIARSQSGGIGYLGCIAIPSACGGTATCECMGCVCDPLGLACDAVKPDTSTGAGLRLDCK